ncbi:MAG: ATP-binding protein [Eubacteriales bacterium]
MIIIFVFSILQLLFFVHFNKDDSKLFSQLIDMRYEKKSTILTTNTNFNNWDEVSYDAVIDRAILDRILHHAHIISITGKSYRLKNHINQDND